MPLLTTKAISEIGGFTASTGGIISDEGGDPVTEYGVVWSKENDFVPDTAKNNKISYNKRSLDFIVSLQNLDRRTIYYVRAYAKNSIGIAYGNQVSFTTLDLPKVKTQEVSSNYHRAISYGRRNDIRRWRDLNT